MKRFLAIFMMLCMVVPLMATSLATPVAAAVNAVADLLAGTADDPETAVDESDPGLTFDGDGTWADDYYETEQKLDRVPHTFAAWVYMPEGMETTRGGVIIGNYANMDGYGEAHLSFEIHTGYKPRLQWYDEANGSHHDIKFGGAAVLTPNQWNFVVIVHDDAAKEVRCYLNGQLAVTNTASYAPIQSGAAMDFAMGLGGDPRTLNSQYFKGGLQDVALYADVLSADEISAAYKNGVDTEDEDLILCYDLDSSDKHKNIEDVSGNGYDQYYSRAWLTEEEMVALRGDTTDRAYSFAVIGDTQYTTEYHSANLAPLYQWIVDEKDARNIQYVIGLGDITNNNTAIEWYVAKEAISIMDGKLEYSLVRGNHDVVRNEYANYFDPYFADDPDYVTQFEQYGGFYEEGSVANTYRTLRIGKTDWLLLNLDWGPTDDMLEWAGDVIASYPDHKVIISTHAYMHSDGTTLDAGDPSPVKAATQNNGDAIWNKLASQYENVELVLCGHIASNSLVTTQNKGVHGNTVTQILIDPQNMDNTAKGLGMVALFYFNEDGTKVDIEYYSTVKGLYYKTGNQKTVDLEAEDAEEYENVTYWDGVSSAQPHGSGTLEDPYEISHGAHLYWMSQTIVDGGTTSNPFADSYFVQTNDINLNGHELPSIGYYYLDHTVYRVFGGTYDGNGYTIKNGTVVCAGTHSANSYWGCALFGMISGATIRNLTLDSISSADTGNVGILVGRANPSITNAHSAAFNLIENCIVTDTCVATSTATAYGANGQKGDNNGFSSRVGGIAGAMAYTTVRNCVSEATLYITGNHAYAGGIAGGVYNDCVIDSSVNGGTVTIDFTVTGVTSYDALSHIAGGIVGGIHGVCSYLGKADTENGGNNFLQGNIIIANCENSGDCVIKGVADKGKAIYWGGILGFSEELLVDTEVMLHNCTNSGTVTVEETQTVPVYTAGIVGYASHAVDATADTNTALILSGCTNKMSALSAYYQVTVNEEALAPIATTHTYGAWTKVDDATHSASCSCGCNGVLTLSHNWNSGVVTTSPTHMTMGVMTYTCVDCGATKTEEIAKTAVHTFGDWKAGADGTHSSACSCGVTRTHSHAMDNGAETDATHLTAGHVTYTCVYCGVTDVEEGEILSEHTFGDWERHDEDQHKRTCACTETEYADHNWDTVFVTRYPTHTEKGLIIYTCSDCSATKGVEVSKLTAHVFGAWVKVNGDTHKKVCACGEEVTESHDWEEGIVKVAATHLSQGIKLYTCTDCGATKTEEIAATTGHTYGAWSQHNATQHKKTCACGDVQYAEHSWNSGEVTAAATEKAAGIKTYTCTDCGATRTEVIAALESSSADDGLNGEPSGDTATVAEQSGLPAGAVVGIAIGTAVLGAGIGVCISRFVFKKKKTVK